ncbi:MAG: cardiolipin synthase [Oscillospiraceae bacterium]
MAKYILIFIYVLLILGVVFIERKNPTEGMLWVVILACIPYLGVILYLAFGNTLNIKITKLMRTKKLASAYKKNTVEELSNQIDALKTDLSSSDNQVIQFNYTYNDSQLTAYDNAIFYIDGESHYKALFEDIYNAKESIHIQFYTIHNDIMGHAFVKALTDKARQGVEVFVMIDFIANISSPPKMFRPLVRAGGIVRRLKPYLTHFRSHRKIVVIDGKVGYIGGMNVGEQYANLAKVKTPWRDTQIRLTGTCLAMLEYYFWTDWICAMKRKQIPQKIESLKKTFERIEEVGNKPCQFVIGGVDTDKESVKMCYLSMIRSAKHKICIQSPYFIPDQSVLDALKTAAASGVQIQLMIPGIKSSFFLDPVARYYCGHLLEYKSKVYKYKGYIHAKTMIVDDEICCVGSVNMDIRSLRVDDEICGVFYDNKLVAEYSKIFENDILNCLEYKYEEFEKRSLREKMQEGFYLLFAPLM